MLNLGIFVREHAERRPDRVAVRMGERALTYRELDAASDAVAAWLAGRGLGRGDAVALSCPNVPWFPVVYYGILKAGATAAPLNVLLKPREIAYHLEDSDAKAYFVFEGTAELPMARHGAEGFAEVAGCERLVIATADPASPSPVEGAETLGAILAEARRAAAEGGGAPRRFPVAATDPSDTAVLLYTSGTTGRPKGAELTHLNMAMNAIVSAALVESPEVPPSERVMMGVLPLFHSFGQTCCMNATFYGGGCISLVPRFEPGSVLDAMRAHGATTFAGVPTMYWALLNAAKDRPEGEIRAIGERLTHAMSGGSALPLEILRRFEEVYGVAIMEGYGLSETAPVASFNHADRPRKAGTIGQPIFGVEMRVVDEEDRDVPTGEPGEVVIRGHNVMKGYYRRPEATAEAMRGGWFHTGDVGVVDEEGYFRIVDRLKDMILRGGYNVYPREVEEVLMTHPAVSLAAVVGVPDEEHGEEVKAFVVRAEGEEVDEETLVAWSRERMAAYKYPRRIEFRDELPMNATGKILRRELRDG